ncbi:GGDEF domain-containing protein [Micavibrio aeruginosavorus]|uniref:GGDEF domain-containing protein n=1 Tax=Micavibrio aeruginosavorus TaxID=349221 RepID=UPI003F4ABD24
MATGHVVIESLASLPHAQEVQDYLLNLAAAATGKKKPSPDLIPDLNRKSSVFVNAADINMVLDHIRTLYIDNGYRDPQDLENDLIRKLQPDMPDAAIAAADHYAADDMIPDQLTGYQQKTKVPLVMGLAALYEQTTGQPVSVMEIDYSNMRGTNEHFALLIGAAEGRSPESVMRDAMNMTDYISLIVAKTITNAVQNRIGNRADVAMIPLRTGGDEVRIVLPGLPANEARALLNDVHHQIEQVTARAGLHDHIHSKRPLDDRSNGFGACATIFELKANGHNDYSEAIKAADHDIQRTKAELGQARLNNPAFDALKPAGSLDPNRYTDPDIAADHYTHVMAAMGDLYQKHVDITIDTNAVPSLESLATQLQPDHFLTLKQIENSFYDHLLADMKDKGLTLTREQERLLSAKVTKFPSADFASGTLIARDFPAMAGAALRVIDDINARTGYDEPPITLGVSFHNLAGLNETLGHEVSNSVLHYQAHQIIGAALHKEGIADENFVLAHMGGGEFRALIQPVIPRDGETPYIITNQSMMNVYKNIQNGVQALNIIRIDDFVAMHGGHMDTSTLPAHFADIQNPRAELRGTENGVVATIFIAPFKHDEMPEQNAARRGGTITNFIGEGLFDAVQKRRDYTLSALPSPHNGIEPTGPQDKNRSLF